jgi:hypothetical protein
MNKDRRGNGKHLPRAVKVINLGFATDHSMSAYKFYILDTKKLLLSNQGRFEETLFPVRTESIIEQDKEDHLTIILRRVLSGATWVANDKTLQPNSYEVVQHDSASDVLIMRLVNETDTYTKTTQMQRFQDLLACQTSFFSCICPRGSGNLE